MVEKTIRDVMKVTGWATINQRGTIRITKGKPNLSWDEVSIFLEFVLPKSLFRKPRLEAKIDIPDEAGVSSPITIDVIENVKEAIETATGLTFAINVIKEEQDAK